MRLSCERGLKEFFFIVGEQAFRSGANLTISILLARSVSKEEYGIYVFLFPLIIIILGIQNGLSSIPYVVLSPGIGNERKRAFLNNVFIFHLIVSFIFLIIGFILAFFQMYLYDFGISSVIIMLYSLAVFSWSLRDFLRQILLSNLDVKSVFFLGLGINGGTIILTGVFYCLNLLSIKSTYWIVIVSSLCPIGVLLFRNWQTIAFEKQKLLSDMLECIKIGKWIVGRSLIGLFSGPLVLLAVMGDMKEAAIYGVCMIPASFLAPIAHALVAFTVPKLTNTFSQGKEKVKGLVRRFTFSLLFPLIIFNAGIFFLNNRIMPFLFDNKYNPSSWLLLLFSLQISVVIFSIPVNSALIAMKDTKSGFIAEIIAASIVVSGGVLMVINWGVWGIPATLLISSLIGRGYQLYIYSGLVKK